MNRRSLVPWTCHPLLEMGDLMERLERDLLERVAIGFTGIRFPRESWEITDDAYIGSLAMPGLDKENIEVSVRDGYLMISAEIEKKEEGFESYASWGYHRSLPEEIDADNIRSKYENGVLELTLPRIALPEPDVEKIEVE